MQFSHFSWMSNPLPVLFSPRKSKTVEVLLDNSAFLYSPENHERIYLIETHGKITRILCEISSSFLNWIQRISSSYVNDSSLSFTLSYIQWNGISPQEEHHSWKFKTHQDSGTTFHSLLFSSWNRQCKPIFLPWWKSLISRMIPKKCSLELDFREAKEIENSSGIFNFFCFTEIQCTSTAAVVS